MLPIQELCSQEVKLYIDAPNVSAYACVLFYTPIGQIEM